MFILSTSTWPLWSQDTCTNNELCDFLVLDTIVDGIYIFEAVTNVSKIFEEDSYNDNTVFVKLMIKIQERIADPIPLW